MFARLAISEIICIVLERLNLGFPKPSRKGSSELQRIEKALLAEED